MKISIIIILCFVLLVYFLYDIYKQKNKLLNKISSSFGKKPENYYEDFDMNFVKQYYKVRKENETVRNSIDELTWNDLDMDLVFKRTNYTSTTLGEAYLYYKYREVYYDKNEWDDIEKLINIFMKNDNLRNNVHMNLLKVGKLNNNNLINFLYKPTFSKIHGYFKYPLMVVLLICSIILSFIKPNIGIGLAILCLCVNALLYHSTKIYLQNNLNVMIYLLSNIKMFSNLCKIKDKEFEIVNNKIKLLLDDFRDIRKIKRYSLRLNQNDNGIMSDALIFIEYVRMFFCVDIIAYENAVRILEKNREKLLEIYDFIAKVDFAMSIAYYRKSVDEYTNPEFIETNEMELIDVYHPLIDNAVKNSINIKNNIMFTGSNASGKSTFIKSIALNCIMAQSLNTALCSKYRGKFSKVITSMAIKDNVLEGDSYFIAEIKSLKRLLDSLDSDINIFIFIDEILKGTNTIERISASAAILKYTAKFNNVTTLVATHDLELTQMLNSEYTNYHFQETVTDNDVIFDYKLREGVSKTRNAIKLLKMMKFESNIVDLADSICNEFIKNQK